MTRSFSYGRFRIILFVERREYVAGNRSIYQARVIDRGHCWTGPRTMYLRDAVRLAVNLFA